MEYDILWSGSHKDVYLCVREPESRLTPTAAKPWVAPIAVYTSRQALKAQVFSLLAERPRWSVRELREALGVSPQVIGGVIQRGVDAGEIARVSYGCIRLKRHLRGEAAA